MREVNRESGLGGVKSLWELKWEKFMGRCEKFVGKWEWFLRT